MAGMGTHAVLTTTVHWNQMLYIDVDIYLSMKHLVCVLSSNHRMCLRARSNMRSEPWCQFISVFVQ